MTTRNPDSTAVFLAEKKQLIAARISPFTTPIIFHGDTRARIVGTGWYIKSAGRFFLATAGHVLDDIAPSKSTPEKPEISAFVLGDLRLSNGLTKLLRLSSRRAYSRTILDLGFVELQASLVNEIGVNRFLPLETGASSSVNASTSGRAVFVVQGYPQEQFRVDVVNESVSPNPVAVMVEPPPIQSDMDYEKYFLLRLTQAEYADEALRNLPSYWGGISGGAVWEVATINTDIHAWSTDEVRVVGFETGVIKRSPHCLDFKCTRIEIFASALVSFCQEMAPIP